MIEINDRYRNSLLPDSPPVPEGDRHTSDHDARKMAHGRGVGSNRFWLLAASLVQCPQRNENTDRTNQQRGELVHHLLLAETVISNNQSDLTIKPGVARMNEKTDDSQARQATLPASSGMDGFCVKRGQRQPYAVATTESGSYHRVANGQASPPGHWIRRLPLTHGSACRYSPWESPQRQ